MSNVSFHNSPTGPPSQLLSAGSSIPPLHGHKLWSDVEQLCGGVGRLNVRQDGSALCLGPLRAQKLRRDALGLQCLHLILHQSCTQKCRISDCIMPVQARKRTFASLQDQEHCRPSPKLRRFHLIPHKGCAGGPSI